MTLPIQTIIGTHEALSDWRFTAQEANQVIVSVWESVIGAVVLAAMTGMFAMEVGKNPSEKPPTSRQSSAPNPRIEQTTVDKVIDDLERTWHKIAYDRSIRMQEALGILKGVMGYHYEQEAVVAWDNSNLIGITVYETILDKDLGVQDTHISELASFTHKPGIGKLLVGRIIEVAKKEGSDAVTVSYAAGYRGFYEKLGFVKDYRYPEAPTLLMYKVKSGNPSHENLPAPTVSEIYGNITVSIPGVRAAAELSVLDPSGAALYGVDPDNWLWFNRLINQSGIPRVGTLLLDAVLNYCREKNYSIINQVSAYGDVKQRELEGWYIRKGFSPVNYKKYGNALLKWTPPNPSSVKLYHCTDESNVDGIMKNGLLSSESASGMLFFFPNLQVAKEAGLSGMAILEVSITDDEIDRCIIGETFPDLYTERFGGEPPADTTLREYIRNPIAYGIPEVCCTIPKIPADRIKYLKTIRR